MAGPNYAAIAVGKASRSRRLVQIACKAAHHICDLVQASSFSPETKAAAETWCGACDAFCILIEAAYDALPDGG